MESQVSGLYTEPGDARLKVADRSLDKLKDRVRNLTRRTRGRRLIDIIAELRMALLAWKAYFGITEVLSPLREIDKWIRRRLRCYQWKQWGSAGYQELRNRGITVREAWNSGKSAHGPWRLANTGADHPVAGETVQQHGVARLESCTMRRGRIVDHQDAGYVTRMSGVVGGRGREASSYPD